MKTKFKTRDLTMIAKDMPWLLHLLHPAAY